MTTTREHLDAVHRELWPDKRPKEAFYKGSPLLGAIRKNTGRMGYKGIHVTPQIGRQQGRARRFGKAQQNVSPPKFGDFLVKPSDDYATFKIHGKLLRSNRTTRAGMVVDALERETKGAMGIIKRSQHIQVCGDGTAARGRIGVGGIAEAGGNTTVTLANPNHIKNFEPDMWVVAAATAVGAARDRHRIIGIDIVAGTFTVAGTAATTSSWAANDYLIADGDELDGGDDPMVLGIQAWIPPVAPVSGENFAGVDRSPYEVQLAGWRGSAAALGTTTIYETIMRACSLMSRSGFDMVNEGPSMALLNGEDKGRLLSELEVANVSFETIKRKGRDVEIYYKGIVIETPIGPIEIFQEAQWESGRVFLMNPDSFTYDTMGDQPQFAEEDGLRMARMSDADAYEGRLVAHPQLSCDAPWQNGNFALPAA